LLAQAVIAIPGQKIYTCPRHGRITTIVEMDAPEPVPVEDEGDDEELGAYRRVVAQAYPNAQPVASDEPEGYETFSHIPGYTRFTRNSA
jgi:hypothetical protein